MLIQRFASKHKPQTFSHVCSRLKRRVSNYKRRVGRWKRDCYRSANAAAILGVTVMFRHGKLHTLVIQSTTLLVLFLQTVKWTGTSKHDSYDQNSTRVCTSTVYHSRFQRQTRRLNWQTRRFKHKQTRETVCGLCLDAHRCMSAILD